MFPSLPNAVTPGQPNSRDHGMQTHTRLGHRVVCAQAHPIVQWKWREWGQVQASPEAKISSMHRGTGAWGTPSGDVPSSFCMQTWGSGGFPIIRWLRKKSYRFIDSSWQYAGTTQSYGPSPNRFCMRAISDVDAFIGKTNSQVIFRGHSFPSVVSWHVLISLSGVGGWVEKSKERKGGKQVFQWIPSIFNAVSNTCLIVGLWGVYNAPL